MFEPNAHYGLEASTECLTESGYILIANWTSGVKVAQFDPSNNTLSYVEPLRRTIRYPMGMVGGKFDVVHIKNDAVDIIVASEHSFMCRVQGQPSWQKIMAKELPLKFAIPVCDNKLVFRPQLVQDYKKVESKYEGLLYSFVMPTGAFVARRKGKVFIVGGHEPEVFREMNIPVKTEEVIEAA